MEQEKRTELISRAAILKMLSEDETGSVSTAETAVSLKEDDEYIDLLQLDLGVQKAKGAVVVMGHVLNRKSVHEDTWNKIVAEVAAHDVPKLPV